MTEFIEIGELEERVILVGVAKEETGRAGGNTASLEEYVSSNADAAADASLDELEELVKTAGAGVAGRLLQKREQIHPGTYVGTGKVKELAADCGVQCDGDRL